MAAHWPIIIVLLTGAYLLGSISSAILVCRVMGYPDPRNVGSNNPGATNVLRVAGKPAAALTLIGDVLKGIVPVLIARLVDLPALMVALIGLMAVIGHIFPVFFDFRGGKGIATAFGLIFVLNGITGLITAAIWLGIFFATRISSLASMLAFITMPIVIHLREPDIFWPMLILTIVLLVRHRDNIMRLYKGQESHFKKP